MGKVLTVATLKGGSGKSTIAACLAVYWHLAGDKAVLIDADPQSSVARIGEREAALGGVAVVTASSRGLARMIETLTKEYDYVIADTAGYRNPATITAIGAADHVLIPIKASPLDFDVASDTAALIFEVAAKTRARKGQIPFHMVFNQVVRGSVISRHMRSEMETAGYPLLDSELVSRIVYGEAALAGATPSLVEKRGKAAQEIAALADEIAGLLKG